jgi:hypothetical protein
MKHYREASFGVAGLAALFYQSFRNSSGSLAIFAAIRRASSLPSDLADRQRVTSYPVVSGKAVCR